MPRHATLSPDALRCARLLREIHPHLKLAPAFERVLGSAPAEPPPVPPVERPAEGGE